MKIKKGEIIGKLEETGKILHLDGMMKKRQL